ncbi:ribosome assembly RNA-binding protein YhbY [Gammaproteobacteria bacterium]|nr:ribosome assembly RNA-binding protein YhbY [Gammaproteobacteria bacterium]
MNQILDNSTKKKFRSIGHDLKTVVSVSSNGLTENVIKEIERALIDHELIKVKVSIADRIKKKAVITKICESFNAQKIQAIGNILLLYRASKKPNKKLSNIDRAYRIQA